MADAVRERARRQVQRIKGFYVHVAVFLVVNAILCVVDLMRSDGALWFYWVVIGWGAGVALHAFLVYGGKIGSDWEQRKIDELVREERKETS